MNNVFNWVVVVVLVVCGYKLYTTEVALSKVNNTLATTQLKLDNTQQKLTSIESSYALTTDLVELRESLGAVVASATVIINSNTQVSLSELRQLEKEISDESTDGNSLHPSVVNWLQRYEESRSSTQVHIPK